MSQQRETRPAEGFRLSPQQRRIWSVKDRYGGQGPWAVAAVRILGPLDVERWRNALDALHERHEILRTRFLSPPGASMPLQVIDPPDQAWSFVAPSADSAASDSVDGIERAVRRALGGRYDPESDPVLHAELRSSGAEEALLILRVPSLVSDVLGMRNLLREVTEEYAEPEKPLEEEPLQYADLAEWQNEILESEETTAGRDVWAQRLDAAGRSSRSWRMPFGRDDAADVLEPHSLRVDLEAELVARAEAVAHEAGTDLETLLALTWQGLLTRLGCTGESGIAGAFEGRRYEELVHALGTFHRFLPALGAMDVEKPLNALLREHGRQWSEAREWQEYFDAETAPSVPFLFRFTDLSGERRMQAGTVTVEWLRIRVFAEDFAAMLTGMRTDDGVHVELHYDAGRFQREEAELLARRFVRLLESAAAKPREPFAKLELLPEVERQRLLFEMDVASSETGSAPSFLDLFASSVERRPEQPALQVGSHVSTYRELQARARRWARHLRSLGVGPETVVALCLERSPDLVATLLGVLEAGAAYVAIEPTTPPGRMALMLEQAEVGWVLTDAETASRVPATEARIVLLEDSREDVDGQPAEPLGDAFDPHRLAYVMFTSGSTGRPKGVGVEHRQLSAYLQGVRSRLGLPDGSSYATVTTFSADLGHTAVFSALASGGRLHVIPGDMVADSHRLARQFRELPVDCLKIVPSHLSALMSYSTPRDFLPRHTLVLGGETAPWDLVERLQVLAPHLRILNHYGPTETTVGVTTYQVLDGGREAASWSASAPIGTPMEHSRIRLLGADGRPVPLGMEGEIHVGGDGLARGYLGNPAATAERFVPDPFSRKPGERLYRTGDRARRAISEDLEFLGRVDDQVKIRGFRVEPGEIATVLERHSGVAAARVLPWEAESGDERLVAYVAVDPERGEALHRWLRLHESGELRGQALHELPNGMAVAHLNANETRFLYGEIFEDRTYLRHGLRLPQDAQIFDVGANVGIFSIWAVRVAPGARVFAFEPVPSVARVLEHNARIYGGDRIRVFEHGLASADRRQDMTHYPHLSMMSSLHADEAQEREVLRSVVHAHASDGSTGEATGGSLFDELLEDRLATETVEVRLRRISDVLREEEVERVDLLKIDVQKSELDVLEGIDEEDWPKIHQVVVEVHDLEGRLEAVTRRLESAGYEVEVEQERALEGTPLHDVYARRPDAAPTTGATWESAVTALESRGWAGPGALREDLRKSLEDRLPDHMIPSEIVLLSRLPLTANGKLDRNRLPKPGEGLLEEAKRRQAPRNETEERLAEIWQSVLGHDHFGIRDGFFEVGGHSLLATQVIARVREDFEVGLPLADFFSHPNIEALARHIGKVQSSETSSKTSETIGRARRDAYRRG